MRTELIIVKCGADGCSRELKAPEIPGTLEGARSTASGTALFVNHESATRAASSAGWKPGDKFVGGHGEEVCPDCYRRAHPKKKDPVRGFDATLEIGETDWTSFAKRETEQ